MVPTRYALRFALICLSEKDINLRRSMQREAVLTHQMHILLIEMISQSKKDATIQTLSARLLSNLITDNAETAFCIMSFLTTSPQEETISNRLLAQTLLASTHDQQQQQDSGCHNWTDLLLACAGNRKALGAGVATLYNGCMALPEHEGVVTDITQDGLLISTLLRHMLSLATSIDTNHHDEDEATEWISLLLEQFCQRGRLPALYRSAAGRRDSKDCGVVVPEHVVLLHAIRAAVDASTSSSSSDVPLGDDDGKTNSVSCPSSRWYTTKDSLSGGRGGKRDGSE